MPTVLTIVRIAVVSLGVFFAFSPDGVFAQDEIEHLQVGLQKDGRIVVPTNQILNPARKQVTFPGRPVDLAFAEDGKLLVVKNMAGLVFIDVETGKIRQTLPASKERGKAVGGFGVVGLMVHQGRIYVTGGPRYVSIAKKGEDGKYAWETPIALNSPKIGGQADPAGIAPLENGEMAVTSTRGNSVQFIDSAGKVRQTVAVGVAPYMICSPRPDRLYVSNWGGEPPTAKDAKGDTSDTPVRVDPRTRVADDGTVSILTRKGDQWSVAKTLHVGLHPSGMTVSPGRRLIFVANANSDTVSVIDTQTEAVIETIPCRPTAGLPFGSGSNAVALSPDARTLYVANGTNNCVGVVRLAMQDTGNGELAATPGSSRLVGLIPTGWYPGAIAVSADGKKLFVANVKGHGALNEVRPAAKGHNSHDHLGSVSIIDVPAPEQLAKYTEEVNRNNRLAFSLAGLEKPRPNTQAIPVPVRHGEPSIFKHVIYIIKENRTYDQLFGDMKEGNGDPNLVLFGENVTPNHHALAREFTLFDNFYCSGVLSADGHSWCDSAYVTDYLEKAFGGFPRSYPDDGRDSLAFSSTGFLWDNALAHQRTLRVYGEFVSEQSYVPRGTTWKDLYADHLNGTRKVPIKTKVNLPSLVPYTHPTYPYFPLVAPDAYRADLFLEDFREFEKKGELPNLLYMSLPCDHTEGTRSGFPTPRAMVADNDLALGRIVETVSKSKFWAETCIFVVEDDPQNGFDHVDGHRTVALVISPYTRRGFVDHTSYNQTGMVKTIELLLGLPSMNQLDLSATAMRNCFQATSDLTPYALRKNKIALDEMNKPLGLLKGKELYWAKKSESLELDKADSADEDTLNRILWHSVRGYDTPYPERFGGKDDDD
jgi:YVTN family beta-propeller protein